MVDVECMVFSRTATARNQTIRQENLGFITLLTRYSRLLFSRSHSRLGLHGHRVEVRYASLCPWHNNAFSYNFRFSLRLFYGRNNEVLQS